MTLRDLEDYLDHRENHDMNIAVDGNNFFHTGWLARLLGLPRRHPSAPCLRDGDVAMFLDGWDMCNETPERGCPNRLTAYYEMLKRGQAAAVWVDDDNNEIVEPL